MTKSQPLPVQKHLFEIPDNVTYLNLSYMSPLMKHVKDAGIRGLESKLAPWLMSSHDFFAEVDRARGVFARLINASAEDISIIPSATYGISTAVCNLTIRANEKIVIPAEEFPAIYYPLERLCRENGAKLVTVERPIDHNWTAAILKHIDASTRAVAISPTHWTDGGYFDVEQIGDMCAKNNCQLIIDGCQTFGAMPFDVQRANASYVVAPTYKWLMGPYGLGFMYTKPDLQSGRPLEEYWASRAGAEDFSKLVNYQSEYAPGARRFDMGERCQFHLLPMTIAALEQLLEWTPTQIQNTLRELTDQLAEETSKFGMSVIPREHRVGHILGLRHRSGLPPQLLNHLKEQNIYVSTRGDSIRVSPYLYNDPQDIERLTAALKKFFKK